MLYENIINFFVEILCKGNNYEEYDKAIIKYGFEIFFTNCLQIITMLAISCIFFEIYYAPIFFISFIPSRILVEGYHCKTFKGCYFFSNICFLSICLLCNYFSTSIYFFIIVAFIFFILFIKYIKNKKLKEIKKQLIVMIANIILLIVLFIIKGNISVYMNIIICSLMLVYLLNLRLLIHND